MSKSTQADVTIIGAGIIGICIAARLVEAGRKVMIIDRDGICTGTSSGNAAALAFSELLPMAQKGMMRQVPGWLLDPLGPLSIPPAYLPKLAPWLYRFWRAASPARAEKAIKAQANLMRLAQSEWMSLMDASGTRSMLREDGCLELYESEAEFKQSLAGWDVRTQHGIDYRHLNRAELEKMQPGLSPRFIRATFVPGWKNVSDPADLAHAIWAYAQKLGAKYVQGNVERLRTNTDGHTIHFANGKTISAGKIIIAAGAWSHKLTAQLGDTLPLETERGYNTTLPIDAFDVKRQLIFPGHGFVITPLATGLRVGGAVELGGLQRKPNFARSKAMLKKAADFLPGLKTNGGREWMGYRPSLPDSLPVIAPSARPGIFYAFGHGHLGLTQAAATARLICDLVSGENPAIDIAPFRAQRF